MVWEGFPLRGQAVVLLCAAQRNLETQLDSGGSWFLGNIIADSRLQ